MNFIQFVAKTYCKAEARYTAAWLDSWVNKKPLTLRDRSRPIWAWALKRWGSDKWPHEEYQARQST